MKRLYLIRAAGVIMALMVVFHLFFPGLFDWDEELTRLSPQNHAIVLMIHYCMTFVFAVLAYFSLFKARDMLETPLGRTWCLAWGLFFLFRAVLGPVFEGLEKSEDVFFLVFLIFIAALYLLPGILGPGRAERRI